MKKKSICVITGSRAEYGLLRNLIREIDLSKNFNYQLICTGSHLSKRLGNTIEEIKSDGFKITSSIPILAKSSSAIDTCNSTSNCLKKISYELNQLKPDIVVLLGDRFEILASAIAATILNIPIAHIHGGEITQGAIDEAFRHSISKMALFHFAATDKYRNRIIQLGEDKERVFNVGAMGIDAIRNVKLFSRSYLNKKFDFDIESSYLMVTFHPETLNKMNPKDQIDIILKSLKEFKNINIVFTGSNIDTGGDEINNKIVSFVEKNRNFHFFKSLGQKLYFSLLKYSSGVVGNSSSGILEAPFFNIGTVNIGNRQKGRLMSDSILNVPYDKKQINKAIDTILTNEFRIKIKDKHRQSPYGRGGASKKIFKILQKQLISSDSLNLNKNFNDIL